MFPKRVFVVGVGMTKFEKPGKKDYPEMGEQAVKRALEDARINYKEVQQVVVGYVYGDSTCGQRAVYEVGMTGVPVYNVNNNCSTGSTALLMAKQLVQGGLADCVLVLGFEKMERGSLGVKFTDRTNPMDKHVNTMINLRGFDKAPPAPQMFGNAGREHMEKYGTTKEQFAKIALKNHKHSKNNPYSQFRDEYTLQEILNSPTVYEPLTKLQCCPTSDGAAAAIVVSEDFVRKHNLFGQAVEIIGMAMKTDYPSSFGDSCIKMVGYDMSKEAAEAAFRQAALTPADVQVIELHDCFSCNEMLTYEALGLCKEGFGGKLIDSGDVTYGGKWVVNPSGGLISKGHPLGATGLAQCAELCWQLRGMCGARQVPNANVALQHNIGLGGAAVVGLYKLGFPEKAAPYPKNRKNRAIDADDVSVGQPAPTAVPSTGKFKSQSIFDILQTTVKENPQLLKVVAAVYQFDITEGPNGQSQSWVVDLKTAPGVVKEGKADKPDCTMTMSDENFVGLMTGKANAQNLFMGGKLKVNGNMALAMKLREIQTATKSKL